jgi:membrane associated rhomboid family serine protease
MGLENREYMRDDYEQPPGWRPSGGSLSVTTQLILAMAAVYLLQLASIRTTDSARGGISIVESWLNLQVEPVIRQGQVWRLLTYSFCHSREKLLHLVMNALLLHFAGSMLLGVVARREFLWFYLGGALFSGIASLLFCWAFLPQVQVLGASGAVLAVMTLAALYYPRREVLLMGIIPLQMRWLLALYVAFDLLPLLSGSWRTGSTANFAHLGGVAFGAIYFYRQMNFERWWDAVWGRVRLRRRNRGNLRIYAPNEQPESQLDSQVDSILQKISEHGEASLTARERNILTQASCQLRKKQMIE